MTITQSGIAAATAKDPEFDAARREARLQRLKTTEIERLEQYHASFLAPGYQPNHDWWGSADAAVGDDFDKITP